MNSGATFQGSFNEKELNQRVMDDIHDAFSALPYISVARDAFIHIVLHCPPEIRLKSLDMRATEELNALMEMYWLPWLIGIYDWCKQFEIVPWYFEKIRGTEHYIPVIPPYGSGRITTFLDKNHKQQFRWYWTGDSTYDPRFYFELGQRPPDLNGKICSALTSIIAEWGTTKVIREATEITTEQQKKVKTLFEYHPPKNLHDDNLETLEAYGDQVASTVMAQAKGMENMKFKMSKQILDWSLMQADAENRAKLGKPVNRSDGLDKLLQRGYASMMSTGTPIPADFVVKTIPSPQVTADMNKIWERLDKACSAIMDIPLQLIESHSARNAASVQGGLYLINKRIKGWVHFFQACTKKAFLLTYGLIVQEGLTRVRLQHEKLTPARVMELYAESEVDVVIPCTPIAGVDDVRRAWLDGFMSKERAAEHTFNMLGFAMDEIELFEYPDMYPTELLQKQANKQNNKTSL